MSEIPKFRAFEGHLRLRIPFLDSMPRFCYAEGSVSGFRAAGLKPTPPQKSS